MTPASDSAEMRLGTTDMFDVWFLPANREAYPHAKCVQRFASFDAAALYVGDMRGQMHGQLEIVRDRRERTRVEMAP